MAPDHLRGSPPTVADADFPPAAAAKRCLGCFYVLDHLPANQCPECCRPFDPADAESYTTKPPFVRWRYWLPGFLLATILGLIVYALLIPHTGFGWAVTLAVPILIGGLVGYSARVGLVTAVLVGWLALITCMIGLIAGGAGGVFCALILLAMAVVPLVLSVAAGAGLRTVLKDSRWDQRHWLPVLLLSLLPVGVAAVELRLPPPPAVTVRTVRVIDAPLPAAWDGVMFYEDVAHDPPWLLRLGLRRPLRTVGYAVNVGDRKTCLYTRGHLTKQVTAVRPHERLEFAVVEQRMFEDYSVRLTGGSFAFERVDGARTRVTLTNRYEPLLRPRWAWQPVEAHVVHLLHGHVLEGMAREADRRRETTAAAGPAPALVDPAPAPADPIAANPVAAATADREPRP